MSSFNCVDLDGAYDGLLVVRDGFDVVVDLEVPDEGLVTTGERLDGTEDELAIAGDSFMGTGGGFIVVSNGFVTTDDGLVEPGDGFVDACDGLVDECEGFADAGDSFELEKDGFMDAGLDNESCRFCSFFGCFDTTESLLGSGLFVCSDVLLSPSFKLFAAAIRSSKETAFEPPDS